jgi:macrolide transport system ATP-binding/permease protein
MWVRLLNKLRFLFRRRRFYRDLADEMDFHREMLELDMIREGHAPEAAAVSARRQLGNATLACECSRDVWIVAWCDTLMTDLRYPLCSLAAHSTFSTVAILTIALGIGANTAIYSFMDSILLRSLPVPDPGSLVILNWHAKARGRRDFVMHSMSGSTWGDATSGLTSGIFPYPAFELFRKYDSVFSSVFAHYEYYQMRTFNLSVSGQADVASGWSVSGDYFPGLAVPATAGRLIIPDDDRPGAPQVAVISYGLSQRRFGEPGNAVGRLILINNLPFTVVGVTPPGFFGVDPAAAPDVYVPMHANELLGAGNQFGFRSERYFDRNYYWVQVMGRLRPGVSLAQAQATLAPPFQQWVDGTAMNDRERANLPELVVKEGAGGLDTLRRKYSQPLFVLMALVGLILSLACANVASLLLTRAAASVVSH